MRSNSPKALEALHAERQQTILALSAKSIITAADIRNLDRLGRCEVANDLWQACSESARHALLHDEHPHVRSCARLAG